MASNSKSNTPSVGVPDHPANELAYGTDDQISALLKLHPIYMPNDNLPIQESLNKLRSSYKYLYVVNWLYQCRGFVKLQSDYFDIDLFEIELLNMVNPPPIDESILFINRLKLALISTLQSSKSSSINNFEKIFRLWFGIETPLRGNEDEEDETPEPKFDNLLIEDKFEILFILISFITQYQNFRNYLDKNNITAEFIRVLPIYSELIKNSETTEEYILLFDNTRLYKRIIEFPELSIPKKRKLAPENPEDFFEPEQFDIKEIKFEIVTRNIYELNSFLVDIYEKRKLKKFKSLYATLADDLIFESIFTAEIKKRKILMNRRKELQLANLLATRKRSSRLEAKEKQRQDELRLMRIQEDEELKIAGEKRLERRRMMKEQGINSNNNSHYNPTNLSREERLKLRKIGHESNRNTQTPEFDTTNDSLMKFETTPTEENNTQIAQEAQIFDNADDHHVLLKPEPVTSNSEVSDQEHNISTSNQQYNEPVQQNEVIPDQHPKEVIPDQQQSTISSVPDQQYNTSVPDQQYNAPSPTIQRTEAFTVQQGQPSYPAQNSNTIALSQYSQPIQGFVGNQTDPADRFNIPMQSAQSFMPMQNTQDFDGRYSQPIQGFTNDPRQTLGNFNNNHIQATQNQANASEFYSANSTLHANSTSMSQEQKSLDPSQQTEPFSVAENAKFHPNS